MSQEKLNPNQALEVLAQVANQVKVTLQEGEVIKQALQVIYETITSAKEIKEAEAQATPLIEAE